MIVVARRRIATRVSLRLVACGVAVFAGGAARSAEEPAHSAALDEMIIKQATRHGVPETLVRRVVMRESRYDPHARNHRFWGLMQISYPTAKSMGFHGSPQDLLNPVVNLTYAVPYLANAFVIAGKQEDAAIRLYASGYYATAKRRGLLGVLRTADSAPVSGEPDAQPAPVAAAPAPSYGIFGGLFGAPQPTQEAPPQFTQTVYAPSATTSAQPGEAVAPSPALPQGRLSDDSEALSPDAQGALRPPKKWLRDGGVTAIARGEQSVEAAVAGEKAIEGAAGKSRKAGHAHKSAMYADLEAPPTSAQAYAATADGQDPHLRQAASQAAIAEATSGPSSAPADQQGPAAKPAGRPEPEAPTADASSKKSHRQRVVHRSHRQEPADEASAPAPTKAARAETTTTEAQSGPQQQALEPEPARADRDDPGAQQQAEARAADAEARDPSASEQTDTPPKRPHHRATKQARTHKAAEAVASQNAEDGQQPPPVQPVQ